VKGTEKELDPSVAVTVADCGVVKLAAVAENVAVEDAAGTATEAGTESPAVLVLVRVTLAPPGGAALFKVTVQVLEELGPRLIGVQASEESSAFDMLKDVINACTLSPS